MEAAGIVNQISFPLPKGSSVRARQEGRDLVGRTDGRRAIWREEYYDETRESDDDCERRRSGARTDQLRGTKRHHHFAAFMHHPSSNVLLYEVALSPIRSPIQRLSLYPPTYLLPFSSHVRIKPHNNGENNRLPAALPPSLSPPLCSLDSSRAHYYDRQWPSPSLPSSPPLILSLHDIVIYLSLMLLVVGHSRYGGSESAMVVASGRGKLLWRQL